jgi:carbon starvation protein CstA
MNRLKLCIPILGAGAVLGFGNTFGFIDYSIIWRYFSWTNQTLAMLVLWSGAMYLVKEKRNCVTGLISLTVVRVRFHVRTLTSL